MRRTKLVIIGEIVISALLLLMLACTEKVTKTKIGYKEPVVFEIYNGWTELPDFENFCKEIWNN